jgi:short-subunit dehydrogenase
MSIKLKPLNEQVIVITGASSGIGLETVRLAAREGAKLVLVARSEDVLREEADRINAQGGEAIVAIADVAHRDQLEQAAQAAIHRFGRIDTWINDAGVSIYGRIEEVSEEDNRRLFDTNFWGVVNGSLVALPYLKQQGGALINLGSEVSDAVVPLQGMYSASKHAVKGFTDALRVELLTEDAPVSVTLIQPTAVDTPYPQHARNYQDQEAKLPDPQIDPKEVAEAIIDAAQHPRRAVKVGVMAHVNTAMAKFAAGLADKIATNYVEQQHYNEPPRNPEGTLTEAGHGGHTHGAGGIKS